MFQIGDRVVYGAHGVCRIVDREDRIVDRKRLEYLVLEPDGQDGSRYLVPTHNETVMSRLRPMLTKAEMEALLQSSEVHKDGWIQDENQRKQLYRELISSGDREKLMQITSALYAHKAAQQAAGKKVHQCDDNFLRDAEKLLSSEIALVMEMEFDQARSYLREQLRA